MPYKSPAQRRWAHTPSAKRAGFPTEEFDKESKGMTDKDMMSHGDKMSPAEIKKKHRKAKVIHDAVMGKAPCKKC